MKALRKLSARDRVVAAAVRFWKDPESQDAMEQLKGTESASAPAAFMLLMEAVEDYTRPAIARLKKAVKKHTPRDTNLRG
jgi:hypothetical protein